MTKWINGKRYDEPTPCDNLECPMCKSRFLKKDPNQLTLDQLRESHSEVWTNGENEEGETPDSTPEP